MQKKVGGAALRDTPARLSEATSLRLKHYEDVCSKCMSMNVMWRDGGRRAALLAPRRALEELAMGQTSEGSSSSETEDPRYTRTVKTGTAFAEEKCGDCKSPSAI